MIEAVDMKHILAVSRSFIIQNWSIQGSKCPELYVSYFPIENITQSRQ